MSMREVQVLQATKTTPNSRGRSNYAVQLDRIRVLESGDYYKALLIISEYVETELSPPSKKNKKTKKKNQPER